MVVTDQSLPEIYPGRAPAMQPAAIFDARVEKPKKSSSAPMRAEPRYPADCQMLH